MTVAGQPVLRTPRLVLRPFLESDAAEVQRLAGDREVASNTLTVPHPYPEGAAEAWIGTHAAGWAAQQRATFAMTTRDGEALIGAIGLDLAPHDRRGELGYWVGRPWWNQGYATEAGRAMIDFGFGTLGLHRIMARHFARNPASGRVLQKLGMEREGVLRGHVLKWGVFEDLVVYAVLA
jgi:ribosomal-protein-alanine N-acetyltransferase